MPPERGGRTLPQRDLAPGTMVGGYMIESLVGRGGMGVVYRAHELDLDRVVALKVIAPELVEDTAIRERFLNEARSAAAIEHPHVIPVHAAGEIGSGAGRGATLNVPLAAGATDDIYLRAYEGKVIPAIDAFRPEIILVSAGYDAHERDPIAGMRVTVSGYSRLAGLIKAAADRHCQGRSMWVTEGGYHLAALGECLEATIGVLR